MAVAIGSNLGDREFNLSSAYGHIKSLRLSGDFIFSPIYRTKSVGFEGAPDFLNAVVLFRTSLSPQMLLDELLAIETKLDRERSQLNEPRTLDLDLLLYGSEIIESASLIVPHPRLHERLFVLVPLSDVASELIHPIFDITVKQLLSKQSNNSRTLNQTKLFEDSFETLSKSPANKKRLRVASRPQLLALSVI